MAQVRADGAAPPAGPLGKRGAPEVSSHRPNGAISCSELRRFGGPADLRRQFWAALKVAHRISANKYQCFCRRVVRAEFVTIEMRSQRERDRASFGGLFHCGRNFCPVCGPKIAAERAADIAVAITNHYAAGGRVGFGTWTMPHNRVQALSDLLGGLTRAYRAAGYNKTPKRLLSLYSLGEIVKLETVVGPNGWHPHRHGFTFLEAGTTDDQAHDLDFSRFRAFRASLERQGFGTASLKGHEYRILKLGHAHEKLGEYLAKAAGHELAAAGTKRARGENRTPLELLIDYGALGREADRQLWLEGERAMHGRRVLRWSPGLQDRLLGPEFEELTDQEAADSTDGLGRVIAAIGVDTWRRVWGFKHPPSVLLSTAESYDDDQDRADAVSRYLQRHQLGELEALREGPNALGDDPTNGGRRTDGRPEGRLGPPPARL